jgi:uncharacterized protein YtpQ (UPF0354 family)
MPTIYPLLKPHNWPHQKLVAHRRLSDTVPGVPIVTFGFDAGDNYRFVPADEVDDVDALYRQALTNLAALDYPWELSGRFAFSSGNEFSAERLLDRRAMLECQRLLESDRIVVAAPRRTCLMAARHGISEEETTLFYQLINYTYQDDSYGHAPISPALFVVEDGVIKHVLLAVEEMESGPSAPASRRPWWKFWQ